MAERSHGEHPPTNTGINNLKLSFWLFLSSECIFFASLLVGYLAYAQEFGNGPTAEQLFNVPLTTLSTFVLLMSSLAMVLAVGASHRGEPGKARTWVLITALMGLFFLGFQAYEFNHFMNEGLLLSTSPFGSSFYLLTGFHGLHVLVGVIWLLTLWWSGRREKLDGDRALDVEIGGLYWHFVDIVWIVLFTVVYLVPEVV
jgi:heme/copper-type cytochrome/quinol oxidase subunit 3